MNNLQSKTSDVYINGIGEKYLNFFLENNSKNIFILVDTNSQNFCLSFFLSKFNISNYQLLKVPAGESSKSLLQLTYLIDSLIKANADRNSILINLGGGVVSDLGGFLASVYNRGISFINVPTTLLAQVDASIGGKNGINYGKVKNKIGVINYPLFTIILTKFLESLPQKEIISGYGEIFKYGLIFDRKLWNKLTLLNLNIENSKKIVERSVKIKKSVIQIDKRKKNYRNILNFGHSIGHAIESSNSETCDINHGLAVVIGMICELYISNLVVKLPSKDLNQSIKVLTEKFPTRKIINLNKVLDYLKLDKKNNYGKLIFSLVPNIGECLYNQEVSEKIVYESLVFYNQLHD